MVSFLQVQCLNCGTVEDVISMDAGKGEASWCSQCGFTRRPSALINRERQLEQQIIADDEQLAALLSKNMWLSERQQPQTQAPKPPPASAAPTRVVIATPRANVSISQHYHHYHPIPQPPAPTPAPAETDITQTISSSTEPPTYIQHLLTTSPNPEVALQDYHRQLTLMEEQYHYQHRLHQEQAQAQAQAQNHYPPSPTGSTVSSIQDDHTLQMILSEQHNLAQEAEKLRLTRAREEEMMIFNQLMMDNSRGDDLMSDDEGSWSGGQPMPNLNQQQQQVQQMDMMGQKVVYPVAPGQPWVTTEEDIYGMDDEESPCSIYYSRMANYSNYL